jgi:hypothetical protein
LITQWNALKDNEVFSTWISSIQMQAAALEQSQVNNFQRWPMLGIEVWPNAEAVGSYDGEIAYFTNWLQLRFAYLDSLFNNKAQTTTTFNVSAATLYWGTAITLTAQVTGGTSPTGTVSFLSNGILLGTGSLSNSVATLMTSNLPVGTNLIQAVYNGDNTNGLSTSTNQSVVVKTTLATTVVSLAGPSISLSENSNSFTASAIPNSGTTVPTGTVTFTLDGGSSTTVTLDSTGQACYSTSSLTVGTHVITATYSGDINYSAASGAVSVTTISGDFTVASGNNSTQTVIPGDSASYSFTLTPLSGSFWKVVTFSVSGLPTGTTATFSPTSIAVGSTATSVTMTVQTPNSTARTEEHRSITGKCAPLVLALLLLPLIGAKRMRKQARRWFALLLVLGGLATAATLSGCGGSFFAQAAKSYAVTVTATSGNASHSSVATLNIE